MDSDGGSIIIGVLLILLIVIIRCFFTVCETALTEISDGLGLSTVTSRRYLKYMHSLGEVDITLDCKTGGRS